MIPHHDSSLPHKCVALFTICDLLWIADISLWVRAFRLTRTVALTTRRRTLTRKCLHRCPPLYILNTNSSSFLCYLRGLFLFCVSSVVVDCFIMPYLLIVFPKLAAMLLRKVRDVVCAVRVLSLKLHGPSKFEYVCADETSGSCQMARRSIMGDRGACWDPSGRSCLVDHRGSPLVSGAVQPCSAQFRHDVSGIVVDVCIGNDCDVFGNL